MIFKKIVSMLASVPLAFSPLSLTASADTVISDEDIFVTSYVNTPIENVTADYVIFPSMRTGEIDMRHAVLQEELNIAKYSRSFGLSSYEFYERAVDEIIKPSSISDFVGLEYPLFTLSFNEMPERRIIDIRVFDTNGFISKNYSSAYTQYYDPIELIDDVLNDTCIAIETFGGGTFYAPYDPLIEGFYVDLGQPYTIRHMTLPYSLRGRSPSENYRYPIIGFNASFVWNLFFREQQQIDREDLYKRGFEDGVNFAKDDAYRTGYGDGQRSANVMHSFISSIFEAPINAIRHGLDVEVLGVNLGSVVRGILTTSVIIGFVSFVVKLKIW